MFLGVLEQMFKKIQNLETHEKVVIFICVTFTTLILLLIIR